jgi:hypothetical protein
VEPLAWQAPDDAGYTGDFKKNNNLLGIEEISLLGFTGPEDIAIDDKGRIYAAAKEGIIRFDVNESNPVLWATTKGRPLGIDFDIEGNLIVADGFLGLLSISPDANVTVLTNSSEGIEIGFADDVDVADNGMIYFSDASLKFKPKKYNDVLIASEFDVLEHGGHGRLLRYDINTNQTHTLISGLNFANGVALSEDQSFVLINEMGSYRVLKYWIEGDLKGQYEVIHENLPGFPDNITSGLDGRFWISLVKPRSKDLDNLSNFPFLRKVATRILPIYHPQTKPYAHIIAIDGNGKVLENLQNSNPNYSEITSVKETQNHLYLGSLVEASVGRIKVHK